MENKQNNKNGFLITWGSCIVFLLVLCFFGISDSLKGTRAASNCTRVCSCPSGGNLSGEQCVVSTSTQTSGTLTSTTGSCPKGTGSCTYSGNGTYSCSCTWTVGTNSSYAASCSYKCEEEETSNCTYASQGHCEGVNGAGNCVWNGNCYVKKEETSNCTYASQGHCEGVTGRTCVYGDDGCYYAGTAGPDENLYVSRTCTEIKGSITGGYWGGTCFGTKNSDGTYSFNNCNCTLACVSGYTPSGNSCVPCSGDNCESCEAASCYYDSSKGYCWGNKEQCSGYSSVDKSQSECTNNPSPGDGEPNPGDDNSGTDPGNPSSSEPGTSSDPNGSNDRGEGCYKNKDTGEFKWFDGDPELNSNTDNYEKVNDSNCEHNVTENPQTGEIAMFFIWIIAFGAVGYSVWYYMKNRKEG